MDGVQKRSHGSVKTVFKALGPRFRRAPWVHEIWKQDHLVCDQNCPLPAPLLQDAAGSSLLVARCSLLCVSQARGCREAFCVGSSIASRICVATRICVYTAALHQRRCLLRFELVCVCVLVCYPPSACMHACERAHVHVHTILLTEEAPAGRKRSRQ